MVGTPWMTVQRSSAIAWSVAPASKWSAGMTRQAPVAMQTRLETTMPKQW
jgi:hypothetical protein